MRTINALRLRLRIPFFAVVLVSLIHSQFARAVTFQINDAVEFAKIIDTNSALTTNVTLNTYMEGPVWVPSGGFLLFCDQTNNKLKKLAPPSTVTDFITPVANTLINGNFLDPQERLISAEAGSAALRIVMITNGVVTPLVSTCNGLKFYSPNDVVVKSDGTIWFTDPGYNGVTAPPPQTGFQKGYYVYRFNPTNGNATCTAVITNGLVRPNGICFSGDETKLFVADSDAGRHNIHVYSVSASNTVSAGSVFATVTNGFPDGIRCDADGRVWSSGGDGLYIFASTDGHLIGKILLGKVTNLSFGGDQYKTLFMVGQPYITSFPLRVTGTQAIKRLNFDTTGGQVNLSWPAPSTGFKLQETDGLGAAANWTNSTLPSTTNNNGMNVVAADGTNTAKFFRLRLQ